MVGIGDLAKNTGDWHVRGSTQGGPARGEVSSPRCAALSTHGYLIYKAVFAVPYKSIAIGTRERQLGSA